MHNPQKGPITPRTETPVGRTYIHDFLLQPGVLPGQVACTCFAKAPTAGSYDLAMVPLAMEPVHATLHEPAAVLPKFA